jgi:hypothetical protein
MRVGVLMLATLVSPAVSIVAAQSASMPTSHPDMGSIEGIVYDPIGLPVPGLAVLIEGPVDPARWQDELPLTDREGHYRFTDLPPGRYHITAQVDYFPGAALTVSSGAVTRHDVTLKVTPLEQEFTVCARCGTTPVPDSLAKEFAADAIDALNHPVSAPRPGTGWEYYLPGMGLYPAVGIEKELEGTVIVEGRIGLDGVPTGMKIVSSTHRELSQATVDALAAEFWEPGRIRGVAFEVPFRFLIRYTLD